MFRSVTVTLRFVLDVIASVRTVGSDVAESFVNRVVHVLHQGEEITAQAVLSIQNVVVRLIEDCRNRLDGRGGRGAGRDARVRGRGARRHERLTIPSLSSRGRLTPAAFLFGRSGPSYSDSASIVGSARRNRTSSGPRP